MRAEQESAGRRRYAAGVPTRPPGEMGQRIIATPEINSMSRTAAAVRASQIDQPRQKRWMSECSESNGCMQNRSNRLFPLRPKEGASKPCSGPKNAAGQNASPKTAASVQYIFRPRSECGVHPVARTALSHPIKLDALDLEGPADESIQVDSSRNSIPAQYADVFVVNMELPA